MTRDLGPGTRTWNRVDSETWGGDWGLCSVRRRTPPIMAEQTLGPPPCLARFSMGTAAARGLAALPDNCDIFHGQQRRRRGSPPYRMLAHFPTGATARTEPRPPHGGGARFPRAQWPSRRSALPRRWRTFPLARRRGRPPSPRLRCDKDARPSRALPMDYFIYEIAVAEGLDDSFA
jgi:hypothetical protein